MVDDPSQRRPRPSAVRVDITLSSGAGSRDVCDVVRAVGGQVISADAAHVVADVPGGAMGSLAVAPGVVRVDGGEPWDALGRQAPDAPAEVQRRRRVEAAEAEVLAEESGSTPPDDVQKG
jgi:hypothetical protein